MYIILHKNIVKYLQKNIRCLQNFERKEMSSQKNMLGSVRNHDRINDGNSDGRTLTRFGTIRKFPSRNIHQISVYFRRRATVEAIRAEAGDTNNLARSRMINVFVSRHRRSVVLLNPIPIMLTVSVPPPRTSPDARHTLSNQ